MDARSRSILGKGSSEFEERTVGLEMDGCLKSRFYKVVMLLTLYSFTLSRRREVLFETEEAQEVVCYRGGKWVHPFILKSFIGVEGG